MKNIKLTKKQKAGGLSAVGVLFAQGFDGIIFNFLIIGFSIALFESPAFSAAVSGLKETLVLLVTALLMGPKLLKSWMQKFKTRANYLFLLAGAIGTAIGNFAFLIGIALAGVGYGVILTAFYPVFSMLIIKIINKEKEPWKVWLGVILVFVSGFTFILIPVLEEGGTLNIKIIIGMLSGLVAAFFWALEGLFLLLGSKAQTKNKKFTTKEMLLSRSIASWFTTIIFIMPIMCIWDNSYSLFSDLITNWKTLIIIIFSVFNLVLLRMFHIRAINSIGPKYTALIDSNNFLVPAVFAFILQFIPGEIGEIFAKNLMHWFAFLLIIPLVFGLYLTIKHNGNITKENQQIDHY